MGLFPIAVDTQNVSNHIGLSCSIFKDIYLTPKGILFNLKLLIMKKNGKNEELQSRREFFKKAAKGALPILGAIVLANAPAIANAAEEAPMGCHYGCSAVCSTSACQGTCAGGCRFTCTHGCGNYGCRGNNKA